MDCTVGGLTIDDRRKPFFETLKSLKNLKRADLGSGVDPDKPLLITTARIYELMHEHWLKMEDLAITGLKSAADGGMREEDEMWLASGAQDVCREEHGSDDVGVHSGLMTFSLVNPGELDFLHLRRIGYR